MTLLFMYGIVLCLSAVLMGGGGHGYMMLLPLAFSPFSLPVPGMLYCLFICPFQWGILAILLHRWKQGPAFVICFLVLHYVVASYAMYGQIEPKGTDLAHFNRMLPGFAYYVIGCTLWYLGGQILLWFIVLKRFSRMRNRSQSTEAA